MGISGLKIFILLCLVSVVFPALRTVIEKEVQPSCRSTYQLQSYVSTYEKCVSDKMVRVVTSLQNVKNATEAVCRGDITICLRNFGKYVKACLSTEKYKELFDETIRAIMSGLNYVCSDNARRLKEFVQKGVPCFEEPDVQQYSTLCNFLIEEWFIQNVHLDDVCRDRGLGAMCFIDAFDQCEIKVARNITSGLLYNALKETRCKSIIEKEFPKINCASKLIINFAYFIAISLFILCKM